MTIQAFSNFDIHQSLPVCGGLAAFGGLLEVAATAVTAIPSVRAKQGTVLKCPSWIWLCGNVSLQALGSLLSHLVATWFGPVSVVVPFFYSATLLANMLIFGCLGETFTKNMRVGTHVIVVAVILLPLVGPGIQEHQHILHLLGEHWFAMAWFVLLLVACAATGVVLFGSKDNLMSYSKEARVKVLLVARAASISVNLTVSRGFLSGLNDQMMWIFVILKVTSGAVYTYAIVVQSYAVEQASFVPLNATTIILVNALTGCLIWEDWKVIQSWYGYICIFVLLGLGCDLLLSVPLLNAEHAEFGTRQRASLVLLRFKDTGDAFSLSPHPCLLEYSPDDSFQVESYRYQNGDQYGAIPPPTITTTPLSANDFRSPIQLDDRDAAFRNDDNEDPSRVLLPTPSGNLSSTFSVPTAAPLLAWRPSPQQGRQPSIALGVTPLIRSSAHSSGALSRLEAWRETVSPRRRTLSAGRVVPLSSFPTPFTPSTSTKLFDG